jgi:hypothetical protein
MIISREFGPGFAGRDESPSQKERASPGLRLRTDIKEGPHSAGCEKNSAGVLFRHDGIVQRACVECFLDGARLPETLCDVNQNQLLAFKKLRFVQHNHPTVNV